MNKVTKTNMRKSLCGLALTGLILSARAACSYTEATGGGEHLDIDYPTYKLWRYYCNDCTCTDNHTDCFGPYPHWTIQVGEWNASTRMWDYTTYGECDDKATFQCVDDE
jgi:hypothetical protein